MSDEYEPDYAEGEIIVMLREELSPNDGLVRGIADSLGYSFLGCYGESPSEYSIKTKPGEEEKAIIDFEAKGEFVEGAYRRDLKFERRLSIVDTLRDRLEIMVEPLYGDSLSVTEWNELLDKLNEEIEKAKL